MRGMGMLQPTWKQHVMIADIALTGQLKACAYFPKAHCYLNLLLLPFHNHL